MGPEESEGTGSISSDGNAQAARREKYEKITERKPRVKKPFANGAVKGGYDRIGSSA